MSGDSGDYGLEDLLGEFGARWSVTWVRYLDGWQLQAVPRPGVRPFIPVARATVAEMRDALREYERDHAGTG
jgi:hypothetical protein